MLKKFVPYIVTASVVIGSSILPSMADDSTCANVVCFPFKVIGSGVGTIVGAPLGITKGGVEGSVKTTKIVAKKLGDEDGGWQLLAGSVIGGPFGLVGGAAYGCGAGMIHGAKTGYDKPFSGESFKFKED